MDSQCEIVDLRPTPFLRRTGNGLRQVARLTVRNAGDVAAGLVSVDAAGVEAATPLSLAVGESVLDVEVPEIAAPCELTCEVTVGGVSVARRAAPWVPPRRWVVHVVQLSHHDVGYTDLASHVIPEHDRWLDAVIDMAMATRDFPDEARCRIVVEQAWSIDHFLRHARPERAAAMLALLRRGDVELTALFGNLVTELCGHEALARSVYHAFRLRREHGIPIVSAEHNDIPGFSWGLCQALAAADVRLLCPGLPKYYSWGHPGAASFWDEAAVFGAEGRPGAFWWEAPSGRRILFWCNNQGCGGGCDPALPGLADRLQQLADGGYAYSVLRWPVSGGARDNSPYIEGYAHTIRHWNECWVSPRLVCSTNARFLADLLPQLPASLPVLRGDVPGQDYPVGSASTAAATAVNRRNHADLPAAEALATAAAQLTGCGCQDDRVAAACEEVLWHDEHTWGHHFAAGPTAAAAELEKAVHAHRAAALTHDVLNKAMARVADRVRLDRPGIHLVVFNPLPHEHSGIASTPLREIDNCGSTMIATPAGTLRGVLLDDRWHVNPPPEIVDGNFQLVDVATGVARPFQIVEILSPLAPVPYAAQRLGLGAGGKRYGGFEVPAGLKRDLVFHAEAVPPLGYRTYRLQPCEACPAFPAAVQASATTLESPWYRLELEPRTGAVRRLFDKANQRELIADGAAHAFGSLVVRDPYGNAAGATCTGIASTGDGALCASLRVFLSAPGAPRVEQTFTLYADAARLDVTVNLVKDPTPLLETYLAFPFDLPQGRFCHEGPLCILEPATDRLPGAYADRLAVQDWVVVSDGRTSVLWSSLDAPVVSLARLWPGRVSPAHSAVVRADLEHAPQTAADLRGGAIYSLLAANNFGTNFAVSQSGNLLFRYRIASAAGELPDCRAAALGRQLAASLPPILTKHPGPRPLPPTGSVLAIDNPAVQLLALKPAEDGRGWVVRLWNTGREPARARLSLPILALAGVTKTTLAEEDTGERLACGEHHVDLTLAGRDVVTLRLTPAAGVAAPRLK